MAGRWDFMMEEGATFEEVIEWFDEDEVKVPLDGFTAILEIREYPGSPLLFRFDTTPSASEGTITVTGGSDPSVKLAASSTLTGGLTPWDDAIYTLELTDGTGKVFRLLEGQFPFSRSVI